MHVDGAGARLDTLVLLGLSEPTVTMVLDNLESIGVFPHVRVVNNLSRTDLRPFDNPRFLVEVVTSDDGIDPGTAALLGVNLPASKRAVHALYERRGYPFVTLVHRSAAVSSTAELGRGINVNSLVSIAAFARLGDFVSINRNASVGHHAELGKFVTVNPGAHVAGFVRIGAQTLIGMGACVMDGICVGANTVIGAGSIVTRDVPAGVIAYGNPCRVVRSNEAQPV